MQSADGFSIAYFALGTYAILKRKCSKRSTDSSEGLRKKDKKSPSDKSVRVDSDKAFIHTNRPQKKMSPIINKGIICGSELLIKDQDCLIGKSILFQSLNTMSQVHTLHHINKSTILNALNDSQFYDKRAFEDEKLVLASAFDDRIKWTDDRRCMVDLNVFKLILDFPLEYPDSPPFFSVHGLPSQKLPIDLDKCLLDLFIPGQVVVFEWIQYLSSLEISDDDAPCSADESIDFNHDPMDNINLPPGCPRIYHSSNPLTDKKSVFIAHCAKVVSFQEIDLIQSYLKSDKKISKATHNITAYRFLDSASQKVREEYDDDGETMAGKRLLHMLQSADCIDVYVMVSRWYVTTF